MGVIIDNTWNVWLTILHVVLSLVANQIVYFKSMVYLVIPVHYVQCNKPWMLNIKPGLVLLIPSWNVIQQYSVLYVTIPTWATFILLLQLRLEMDFLFLLFFIYNWFFEMMQTASLVLTHFILQFLRVATLCSTIRSPHFHFTF